MKSKLNKTVTAYTLLMLIVFPLFMVHSYYDIQTVKMYLYQISTLVCAALTILIAAVYIVRDKDIRTAFISGLKPCNIRKSIKLTDIFAVFFLIAILISTFSSEWVYEAFWGNMARFQGGYMMMLFVLSYFMVSRYYVPRRWHFDLMLLAGIIQCGWAVIDYFGMSPVGFDQSTGFSSTIGNIDVLTAMEVMFVGVASVLYISETDRDRTANLRSVYYLIAALICFMGLECGRTANLLLSAGFLICFMPFYAFGKARSTLRYIDVLMAYLIAMLIIAWLVAKFPDNACPERYMGELDKFANTHPKQLAEALLALALVRAVLSFILRKFTARRSSMNIGAADSTVMQMSAELNTAVFNEHDDAAVTAEQAGQTQDITETINCETAALDASERRMARALRIVWALLGAAALCLVIYIFYDANTGGHPERYAEYSKLLIFNDAWGSSRGFIWKLAMKYYEEFTLFKKLFGSGPETFAIYVIRYDLKGIVEVRNLFYDSIHNEWFQHLFECGIMGCIGFYGLAVSAVTKGLKAGRFTAALSFAVIAYLVQSFVNISVPILLPFVIICMSAAAGHNTYGYDRQ